MGSLAATCVALRPIASRRDCAGLGGLDSSLSVWNFQIATDLSREELSVGLQDKQDSLTQIRSSLLERRPLSVRSWELLHECNKSFRDFAVDSAEAHPARTRITIPIPCPETALTLEEIYEGLAPLTVREMEAIGYQV